MEISLPSSFRLSNVLLTTDFSTASHIALKHTTGIVRRYGARLYLLNVVRPSDPRVREDAWREGQRYMTDQFIAGQFDGIEYELMVEAGDVWHSISRNIAELKIDLVVAGARARTGIGKLLLGSVAEDIFRQAPCPVLLVGEKARPDPVDKLRKILFCTGFSAHSLNAGGYALALAERQNAQLAMLHVVNGPVTERAQVVESATARLRSLLPAAAKLASPPECLVRFGSSAACILQAAVEQECDLIVMGVRQPPGMARRFKWATAYEVVIHAPCPVLTVRTIQPE